MSAGTKRCAGSPTELIETHADTAGLLSYLAGVSDELRAGHYTPTFHRLFAEFTRQAPLARRGAGAMHSHRAA